jgi:hypothetical protein
MSRFVETNRRWKWNSRDISSTPVIDRINRRSSPSGVDKVSTRVV